MNRLPAIEAEAYTHSTPDAPEYAYISSKKRRQEEFRDCYESFQVQELRNRHWIQKYIESHKNVLSIPDSMFLKTSIWMNEYFQRRRMLTNACGERAAQLLREHAQTVQDRLFLNCSRYEDKQEHNARFSTVTADPLLVIYFCLTNDRTPSHQISYVLEELQLLLQFQELLDKAIHSGIIAATFKQLQRTPSVPCWMQILDILIELGKLDPRSLLTGCNTGVEALSSTLNEFFNSAMRLYEDNAEVSNRLKALQQILRSSEQKAPKRETLRKKVKTKQNKAGFEPYSVDQTNRDYFLDIFMKENPSDSEPTPSPSKRTTKISPLKVKVRENPYLVSPDPNAPQEIIASVPKPGQPRKKSKKLSPLAKKDVPNKANYPASEPKVTVKLEPAEAQPTEVDATKQNVQRKKQMRLRNKYEWHTGEIGSAAGFTWYWRSLPEDSPQLQPKMKFKMVAATAAKLHQQGELDDAVNLYAFALKNAAEIPVEDIHSLRLNLAMAYERMHMFASAVHEYYRVLDDKPQDEEVNYRLGIAYYHLGNFDDALATLKLVSAEIPHAASLLSVIEKRNQGQRQEIAEKGVDINPIERPLATFKRKKRNLAIEEQHVDIIEPVEEEEDEAKEVSYSDQQWRIFTLLAISAQRADVDVLRVFQSVDRNGIGVISLGNVRQILTICSLSLTRADFGVISECPYPLVERGCMHYTLFADLLIQALAKRQQSIRFSSSPSRTKASRQRQKQFIRENKLLLLKVSHDEAMYYLRTLAQWTKRAVRRATFSFASTESAALINPSLIGLISKNPFTLEAFEKIGQGIVESATSSATMAACKRICLENKVRKEVIEKMKDRTDRIVVNRLYARCLRIQQMRERLHKSVTETCLDHAVNIFKSKHFLHQLVLSATSTCKKRNESIRYFHCIVRKARTVLMNRSTALTWMITHYRRWVIPTMDYQRATMVYLEGVVKKGLAHSRIQQDCHAKLVEFATHAQLAQSMAYTCLRNVKRSFRSISERRRALRTSVCVYVAKICTEALQKVQ